MGLFPPQSPLTSHRPCTNRGTKHARRPQGKLLVRYQSRNAPFPALDRSERRLRQCGDFGCREDAARGNQAAVRASWHCPGPPGRAEGQSASEGRGGARARRHPHAGRAGAICISTAPALRSGTRPACARLSTSAVAEMHMEHAPWRDPRQVPTAAALSVAASGSCVVGTCGWAAAGGCMAGRRRHRQVAAHRRCVTERRHERIQHAALLLELTVDVTLCRCIERSLWMGHIAQNASTVGLFYSVMGTE